MRHLFHPDHVEEYVATMRLGVEQLADTLRSVRGPATGLSPERAAKPIIDVDLDRPAADPSTALAELRRLYLEDAVWFHEPSYAAHLNCPVVIPALLAELYVSAVNTSMDTFDQSVGGTFIERRLVEWTAERIGLPDTADGVFTSGGTQSNLQALHLARDRALARGRQPTDLRILTSGEGHFSVQKAARLLGLGDGAVVRVPVDRRHRMDPDALATALAGIDAAGHVPAAVVATAGTTDWGSIDPLPEVAGLAAAYGAWLHVDAAYGGGLLTSRTRRHRLAGIERADSVTVDYHKTWFQPVSSSALLVRDRQSLGHVTWHADYLNPRSAADAGQPNQVDKSLQTTRRFDALKLWLTLRVMGADTLGDYVDAILDLTRAVHAATEHRTDLEYAAAPELSTLVFRYAPTDLPQEEVDRLVPAIRRALYADGAAMVAATRVDGRPWLKMTLLNPLATRADIVGILDRVAALGAELSEGREGVA